MSNEVAHKRWWQIFEVIVGIPFLAAIALQLALPLRLPRTAFAPAIAAAGIALIGAGVALVVLARREFARRGQPTDPGRPTSALVTTGVFAISRNPLYLGGAGVLLGSALAFNLPWALVLLPPSLAACQIALIAPEERYLAAMFGERYRDYAASVRRWVGRSRPRL
ncbi:MAG TPA: isoprenylcysteine carboxylmethyltransferase family protein [Herpetosiphonaceae bacterium]|nr:isoprenylcysteine carboxylmethyltransferase family protein [Herpetosiphonaceae bacterium]